jgi:uncharacterized protein
MLHELITNYILIVPLCTWAIAQILKTIVAMLQGKGFDLSYLVSSGGMPSAHSAMVSSLAAAVAISEGFGSAFFAVSVVLAVVVMYDAAGVRQSVGKQSVVINRIIREIRSREPLIKVEADLRELMGHTPFQVIVGGALGIAVACIWFAISGV